MPHPPNDSEKVRKSNRYFLLKYGSFAIQLLAALLLSIIVGMKVDDIISPDFLLLTWLLPLFIVVGMIIKVMKDTARKK